MAHAQRLKLTLRNRMDGREWTGQSVEVTEDPEDLAAILKHLPGLAESLDRGFRRLSDYELKVQGLDQEWRRFTVPGRD